MDPGEAGFLADEDFDDGDEAEDIFDEIEEDSVLEDCEVIYAAGEDDYDIEMEEFAALGIVMGFAQNEIDARNEEKRTMSDEEVDRAIDEMEAGSKGYCRMKGLWRDNPELARYLFRRIYKKD